MNRNEYWPTQLKRLFQPYASKLPEDIQITAGRIDRGRQYAIIIRLGDRNLTAQPDKVRHEIAQSLDEALAYPDAEIFLHSVQTGTSGAVITALIGLACGAGVQLIGQDPTASFMALLVGAAVHRVYHFCVGKRKTAQSAYAAGEIMRQFRPHGDQPAESEAFHADAQTGAATFYRRLPPVHSDVA